jgi:hypothetical protein
VSCASVCVSAVCPRRTSYGNCLCRRRVATVVAGAQTGWQSIILADFVRPPLGCADGTHKLFATAIRFHKTLDSPRRSWNCCDREPTERRRVDKAITRRSHPIGVDRRGESTGALRCVSHQHGSGTAERRAAPLQQVGRRPLPPAQISSAFVRRANLNLNSCLSREVQSRRSGPARCGSVSWPPQTRHTVRT